MHPDSMSLTIYLTPLPKPSKKAVKATLMDASKKKDKKKGEHAVGLSDLPAFLNYLRGYSTSVNFALVAK